MRADYKEIRLSTFNDALKRMEAIKETSDISSKVSQVQNIISLSKGDSVPQIQEINAMMITIVKAMEDLFINTYGVLENSYGFSNTSLDISGNYCIIDINSDLYN